MYYLFHHSKGIKMVYFNPVTQLPFLVFAKLQRKHCIIKK